MPKIFEPFSQEDVNQATKYGSTGLGMAITKNIVDMLNGKIEVDSEKGVGSTFTVTISLKIADGSETAAEVIQPPEEVQTQAEVKSEDLTGKRILIAEDMLVNADILKEILLMRFIESERAENGQVAVDMFAKSAPGYYDAILMDIRMPIICQSRLMRSGFLRRLKLLFSNIKFLGECAVKKYAAKGLTACTYNTVEQVFYSDGWLKDENVAIISCDDGTRPVVFKIEATDEDAH